MHLKIYTLSTFIDVEAAEETAAAAAASCCCCSSSTIFAHYRFGFSVETAVESFENSLSGGLVEEGVETCGHSVSGGGDVAAAAALLSDT